MTKTQTSSKKLFPMAHDDKDLWRGDGYTQLQELEAMVRTVSQLREALLDHSPMLAISAEALEKAVALEIATQRAMIGE